MSGKSSLAFACNRSDIDIEKFVVQKCKKLFFGLKFSSIIKTLTFVTVSERVEFW